MYRWFFEVPGIGHGLQHFAVDNPPTTTQLMDEQRRNGTQLQITGIEIGASFHDRLFYRSLASQFVPTNQLATVLPATYRFDDSDRAVARRPIDFRRMPKLQPRGSGRLFARKE